MWGGVMNNFVLWSMTTQGAIVTIVVSLALTVAVVLVTVGK